MSRPGDDLAPFIDALRARLERAQGDALPDLVEVVEAAHALDPAAVSAAMVDEARGLAQVVRLQRRRDVEADLGPFVDALGAATEASLEERGLASIPPLRAPPRRWARAGVVLGIAAALALLFVALRPALLAGIAGDGGAVEAQRVAADPASARTIQKTGPYEHVYQDNDIVRVDERGPGDPVHPADHAESPTGSASVDADLGADLDADAADAAIAPSSAAPARAKGPGGESLAALDARAQAAWQRGDLSEAERLLRELIERSPRSSRAELAYGDLFVIAHQRGRADRQRRTWQAYLRAFPRGRFADDARAGLCRQQGGELGRACWRRYLAQEASGSHRSEAAAAIARAEEATR